ncbi:MAG: 16S rRNA (cytidine(1402)-2'-O)-methyltransferase [Pseudomonadota bacterium]|nr:16S rRNA (cytidine(1402)-2'-O)-methyltransferase [Pseudomonadota bacterium]
MSESIGVGAAPVLAPGLYVVATPIGNLGDISPRAVGVLRAASQIAAEDSRHTRKLLSHLGIRASVTVYNDHSVPAVRTALLERVLAGAAIALVSDAGTPLIADPGYRLVREAHALGIAVVPVPGPSALIGALSVSGQPTDQFCFEGFLPAKPAARAARLQRLAREPRTLIFFEAPHRLAASLTAMAEAFGADRSATVSRELTKRHERVWQAPLGELAQAYAVGDDLAKGEIVLVVDGAPSGGQAADDVEALRVLQACMQELPLARAARLAHRLTGVDRKRLYQWGLEQGPCAVESAEWNH